MKKIILVLLLLFTLAPRCEAAFASSSTFMDAIAVYYARNGRLEMNRNDWQPYVTHTFADGHTEWLFQAFWFEDFSIGADKKLIHFVKKTDVVYANKADWQSLIDKLFMQNRLFDTLDKCIEENKQTLGEPPFRHKVVIGIPMPIKGQSNWGTVGRSTLNFSREADRLAAIYWYIDEALKQFNAHHYRNIDLDGFLWIEEDMEQTQGLAIQVSNYIHRLGYRHYWAPYLKANGSTNWERCGFDLALTQPGGYAFNTKRETSVVLQALDKARTRNMGLVMEFEATVLTDPNTYQPRLGKVIDMFEANSAFDNTAFCYYDGMKVFNAVATGVLNRRKADAKAVRSARPLFDRMANIIVSRWKRRYGVTNHSAVPGVGNQGGSNSTNNGGGGDWRDPDYWHF